MSTHVTREEMRDMLYARALKLLENCAVEEAAEKAREFAEDTALVWVANGYTMLHTSVRL
jgi:hypothetical protein